MQSSQRRLLIIIGALSLLMYLHLMWMISGLVPEKTPAKINRASSAIMNDGITSQEPGQTKEEDGRLFCWIMTSERNQLDRAKYLKDTWPQRCDQHFFFTDNNAGHDENRFINVFKGLAQGYNNLWAKTKAAMQYINDHYADDFDWFLKADDDTYVIVENLRDFLFRFNKSAHHYSGHTLKTELVHGHNSGGAGYVLSRSTLKLLVQVLPNKTICPGGWAEDVEVARCLENLGIYPIDTVDDKKRDRFIYMHPAIYNFQLLGAKVCP